MTETRPRVSNAAMALCVVNTVAAASRRKVCVMMSQMLFE